MNESELRDLMYTAQLESTQSPFSIRYPRGKGTTADWRTPMKEIIIGTGRKLKEGKDIAIISFGHPGNVAAEAIRNVATEGINAGHYDIRFVKPLDKPLLHGVFQKYSKIITIEDGTMVGGFGSAILEFMNAHGYTAEIKIMGIPDRFIEHGSPDELYGEIGLDAGQIIDVIRNLHRKDAHELIDNK